MNRKTLGRILITIGGLAWVPYFGLQWFTEINPPMWPFLTVHLMGVIPGTWIQGRGLVRRLFRGD